MTLVVSSLQTAIMNLIVFLIIPFLWWLFIYRKRSPFFKSLGITKPRLQYQWRDWLIFAAVYFLWNSSILSLVSEGVATNSSDAVAVSTYMGIGTAAILPSLIEDFISNGLCEELFFRGFLCKRLSAKFGMAAGIVLQAIAFGLLHNVIYLIAGVEIGMNGHIMLFIGTGLAGLACGLLNEKLFCGSIIPSILLHGAGNFSSSISEAFGWTNRFGVYSTYIVVVISVIIVAVTVKKNKEQA